MSSRNKGKGIASKSDSTPTRKRSRADKEPVTVLETRQSLKLYKNDFGHRKYVHGKEVTDQFLDTNFPSLRDLFSNVNWTSLLSLREKSYPECIRWFYANLEYDSASEKFTATVKGHTFNFDSKFIARILNIPRSENKIASPFDFDKAPDYDRNKSINELCGVTNLKNGEKIKSKTLSVENRLIHHIITHNVIPRTSSRDTVTVFDAFLIWSVVHAYPVDLPHIICHEMVACRGRQNQALPYGMLITKILKKVRYNLHDEIDVKAHTKHDSYSETSLRNMNLVKVDDNWVRGDGFVIRQDVNVAPSIIGGETFRDPRPMYPSGSASGSAAGSSDLSVVIAGLSKLSQQVSNMQGVLSNMSDKVATILTRLDELDQEVAMLKFKGQQIHTTYIDGFKAAEQKFKDIEDDLTFLLKK